MTAAGASRLVLTAIVALGGGLVNRAEAQTPGPAQSFAALRQTIGKGERVIVVDRQNRRATGEVLSISGDQIEILSTGPGMIGLPAARRTFTLDEDDVRWIGRNDGTWNGQLIGFGSGLLALPLIVAITDSERAQLAALIFAVPIGGVVGRGVDSRRHQTLYGSLKTAVVVTASFSRGAVGLQATVAF